MGAMRWDDIDFGKGINYDKWEAYGQSKTAVILHALALAKNRHVGRAFAVHPGESATNLMMNGPAKEEIDALSECK